MIADGFREFTRLTAAEGAVLLKNDGGVLPIKNESIALFGRCQTDYYRSGLGSGGSVNTPYVPNLLEAFSSNEYISVDEELAEIYKSFPLSLPRYDGLEDDEPDIPEEIIAAAAKRNEKAVIIIGRRNGESNDTRYEKNSFFLGDSEVSLLTKIKKYFSKIAVILNIGNLIDLTWIDKMEIQAALLIWLGGEEGANGAADVISGKICPSGRLANTVTHTYEAWPSSDAYKDDNEVIYTEDIYVGYRYFETFAKSDVLYPFGYGLSYTDFEISCTNAGKNGDYVNLAFDVKNVGSCPGKQVVQVYMEGKTSRFTRPSRELACFVKTNVIAPGEVQSVSVSFDIKNLAAFDDEESYSWIIENGIYTVFAGENVREAEKIFEYEIDETITVKQAVSALAPIKSFDRIINDGGKISYKPVKTMGYDLKKRIADEIPNEIPGGYVGDFATAVKEGKIKEFVGSMSDDDMMIIARGEGSLSPKVTPGVVACFGGVGDNLLKIGVPLAAAADGPSGIRLDTGAAATCMPCGSLMACTWDPELIRKLYTFEGRELVLNKVDVLLGPGMNIHRTPLCGRNFEYFSEDPLISGVMGAAVINGINDGGSAGVLKHFAANNREYLRGHADSVVSERALREIYLKSFEIAVKTSPVLGIMTSYNPINGYHNASNYDLTTTVLRNDWGYDGLVMTDWWSTMNYEPYEKADGKKAGALIRSQNDIFMVVTNFEAQVWADDSREMLEKGVITRSQLQRNTYNILNALSKMLCFERQYGFKIGVENKNVWFEMKTDERKYDTFPCPVPETAVEKRPYMFMDMLGMEKVHEYEDIWISPFDLLRIDFKSAHEKAMARVHMFVSADMDELAQFGVFATVHCYEENRHPVYPVSFVGTGGEVKEITFDIEFSVDWTYIELDFVKSNPCRVRLHKVFAEYI